MVSISLIQESEAVPTSFGCWATLHIWRWNGNGPISDTSGRVWRNTSLSFVTMVEERACQTSSRVSSLRGLVNSILRQCSPLQELRGQSFSEYPKGDGPQQPTLL